MILLKPYQLYQFYEDLAEDKIVLDPSDYTEKHVSELFEELKDCIRFNVRYIGFDYKKNKESSKRTTFYYFPKELKNAALHKV